MHTRTVAAINTVECISFEFEFVMPLCAGCSRVACDNREVSSALREGRGRLSQHMSSTCAASSIVMCSTDGRKDIPLACIS